MRTVCLIAIAAITIAVLFAGCSRTQTYSGPGGSVRVTENGGEAKTMEFNGKEGKATVDVGKKTVTEAEVGVPVYPGATAELTGNYAATGQQESVQHTMLTTPDSFDKVAAFYKANLKNVGASTVQDMGGNGKVAMFQVKGADGSEIAVNIIADKDKEATKIQIVKTQKAK